MSDDVRRSSSTQQPRDVNTPGYTAERKVSDTHQTNTPDPLVNPSFSDENGSPRTGAELSSRTPPKRLRDAVESTPNHVGSVRRSVSDVPTLNRPPSDPIGLGSRNGLLQSIAPKDLPSQESWPVDPDQTQQVPDIKPPSNKASGALGIGSTGSDSGGLRYEIIAPLDKGGMGELFVARVKGTPETPKYAVIKRLLPDLVDDNDYVEMFHAEARIMGRLNHPNVVRVLGLPMLSGNSCLALEYVEGRNVQQLISRGGRLHVGVPPSIAVYIALGMAKALDHVHKARDANGRRLELVHRDVSPGNVLLGFNGDIKLTDFGIAKTRISNVSTTVGIVKGKARYLAPEQILGRNATPKSDLFSAALVLVEMLTNTPLFERGTIPKTLYAIVNGERPNLSDILPINAKPLAPILETALETDPTRRLQSAHAFVDQLQNIIPKLGPRIDTNVLGQHLRGVFEGTPGPLTRVGRVPTGSRLDQRSDSGASQLFEVSSLPKASGASPLNPESFPQKFASVAHSATSVEPSHALSAHAGIGEVGEVDQALSVLAWLQSRDSSPANRHQNRASARTSLPARATWPGRLMLFLTGWIIGVFVVTGAIIWLNLQPSTIATQFQELTGLTSETTIATLETEASPSPTPEPAIQTSRIRSRLVFNLEPLKPSTFIGPNVPSPPPPKPEPKKEPPPPPPKPARLEILGPRKARITLDGKKLVRRAPIKGFKVEPGSHRIELQRGRIERTYDIRIKPGEIVIVGKTGIRRPDTEGKKRPQPKATSPVKPDRARTPGARRSDPNAAQPDPKENRREDRSPSRQNRANGRPQRPD